LITWECPPLASLFGESELKSASGGHGPRGTVTIKHYGWREGGYGKKKTAKNSEVSRQKTAHLAKVAHDPRGKATAQKRKS
jgi:hypothetical protein